MVEDVFVRLPLPMFDTIIIFRVRGDIVAGPEVREVALDIAGRAGASRRGESNVRRHVPNPFKKDRKSVDMLWIVHAVRS